MKLKKILFLLIILLLPLSVNAKEVDITLFYGDGCPHCAHEEKYLEVLEKQLGKNIQIEKYEVWNNKENEELLKNVREALKDENEGVPFLVVGDKYFSGYNDDIAKDIKKEVIKNLKQNKVDVVDTIKSESSLPEDTNLKINPTLEFSLLGNVDAKEINPAGVALTEGVSDAINLGSLWVIFFLGSILLAVYNKKKRWILGSTFVIISAVTYMIFALTNINFTVNQTTFIRSFIAIMAIIIAAITIDAHMKINVPKKSILQKLGEIFGKRQMLIYGIMITVISILTTFVLVNQASSSPLLFKTLLEIQNVDSMHYIIYIGLYFITYLVTSFILLAVINTMIKELFVENTIGTYNRLISGILVLALATILLFVPGIFMMV